MECLQGKDNNSLSLSMNGGWGESRLLADNYANICPETLCIEFPEGDLTEIPRKARPPRAGCTP